MSTLKLSRFPKGCFLLWHKIEWMSYLIKGRSVTHIESKYLDLIRNVKRVSVTTTASVCKSTTRATWALLFWHTWSASSVCKPTTFVITERGFRVSSENSFHHWNFTDLPWCHVYTLYSLLCSSCYIKYEEMATLQRKDF